MLCSSCKNANNREYYLSTDGDTVLLFLAVAVVMQLNVLIVMSPWRITTPKKEQQSYCGVITVTSRDRTLAIAPNVVPLT